MLWIPGPTEVRPEVLAECARPAIGHRSAAMVELIERLDPHLIHAFGLSEGSTAHLGVHSTSASGMMEGALLGSVVEYFFEDAGNFVVEVLMGF